MPARTRFTDELMERAVRSGATQFVILGAGFDTGLTASPNCWLKDAAVIEIDYGATQEYKQRRVEAALGGVPANVVYARSILRGKASARCCALPVSSPDARPITFARASACTSRKKG
jgi:O-methyltransferase involved in polyketide biosynthesis